ncbi:contact-dependent growth inhibition system immunity protein [Streptomyces cocklensis]|uniref:CdiI_2 domain-containing protein n=1 Tax=Actinacidiphila cocklensis TaxID=887465 RepID=A0A9W4E9F9_9ACTN|nr:contact-dependent growth inhibition system immunity protein [Actinacidiphila cocklensis]MDD1061769.1 contact-dependent growth inhibition system immunity protein [Actinacidiphila cocklensis]CAG6396268.1 CdiI_2 domain-containing protein [Actinacidiphila cocklensis]
MEPLQHDRSYGELDQVMRAYLGEDADDTADKRGAALDAYLRQTWHTRPWALATAERQLREYARNPPGRLRHELGEFYPVPDTGVPQAGIQAWLLLLADHLARSVAEGDVPPPDVPRTHWEWHARFPELGQLLGGWFSQDMPDEFEDHDEALADYLAGTHPALVARLAGELRELLALPLEDAGLAAAAARLGLEMQPPDPYSAGGWLARLADEVTAGR